MEQFRREFAPHRLEIQSRMHEILRKRGATYENQSRPIDQIISDETFNIYVYPGGELDSVLGLVGTIMLSITKFESIQMRWTTLART